MTAPEFEVLPPRFQPLAYLQLLRLPNVFTAMADIFMGYLFSHMNVEPWPVFGLLLAASSLLYLAGMVLNDVFDRDIDARDRPGRPIPSGRVPLGVAVGLGYGMLALGTALGWGAAQLTGDVRPGVIATLLAAAVMLYNKALKQTPLAPLAMGACRFLNVLLGMSTNDAPWQTMNYLIAGGVGLYIAGVTWFARTEATESKRPLLSLGVAVMLAGLALLAWFPNWQTGDEVLPLQLPENWLLFWGMLAGLVTWRCVLAISDPQPELVQSAVKNSILSLIIVDAGIAMSLHSPTNGDYWALVILALMVPTVLLGRFVYST